MVQLPFVLVQKLEEVQKINMLFGTKTRTRMYGGEVQTIRLMSTFFLNRQRAIDYLNTRDQIMFLMGLRLGPKSPDQSTSDLKGLPALSSCITCSFVPIREELENFGSPDCVIYNAGQFPANSSAQMTSRTSVDISLERKEQVILGTEYAGEMKKGVFTLMHWLLPPKGVLSILCGKSGAVGRGVTFLVYQD